MAASMDRLKVPAPTWVPINKTTLSSWRSAPTVEAPKGGADRDDKPRDIYVVRSVGATLPAAKAAAASVAGSDAAAVTVAEMTAPRAIAKGMTPQAGPADAPLDGMSPGVSPSTTTRDPRDMPPPLDGGMSPPGGGMPEMSLGPRLEETLLKAGALVCAVTRDRKLAEAFEQKLKTACPAAVTDIMERPYPSTCTVVLKGVPLSIKHDRLGQELTCLQAATPAYLRFHRNDRGLFKNVVYVKFASPLAAELGRIELERFSVGGRPLKVELKKPKATTTEESARAEAARREDLKVATLGALDAYVTELAKSADNEAFTLPKAALSKEEVKYLRGVCQAHDFTVDQGAATLTVKKKISTKSGVSPSMGPARTPPFHPATPSVHAADPSDMAGMQFRGIRHWREQRATIGGHSQLGLHRSLGPSEGVAAWSPGRGRPQR